MGEASYKSVTVWTYVTLEPLPLSMIVDRYSGLDGSGGPRRRLVTHTEYVAFWALST